MNPEDRIKLFRMSHTLVERDLDKVEEQLRIDLQRGEKDTKDEEYYPQLDLSLRTEAAQMGEHYELFYCLEKSIRKLISETLEAQHGENWWDKCVQDPMKTNVNNNIQKELDSGMTLRSNDDIDYATFGELGEIVRSNWASVVNLTLLYTNFEAIIPAPYQVRGKLQQESSPQTLDSGSSPE